jgi:hypothetical protein
MDMSKRTFVIFVEGGEVVETRAWESGVFNAPVSYRTDPLEIRNILDALQSLNAKGGGKEKVDWSGGGKR